MAVKRSMALGIFALVLYLIGGIATFGGLYLAACMKGRDLFGLGDGRAIGWLFLCVGLCLSIMAVLFMRIFRNRGFA